MSNLVIGIVGEYDPTVFASEKRFHEHVQEHLDTTRTLFLKRGGFDMFTLVFCTQHPSTGKRIPLLWTICPELGPTRGASQFNSQGNEMLHASTRVLAQRGHAEAVVLIAEAAAAPARNDVDSLLMANGVTKPRDHPDRKDVVWVSIEHKRWFAQAMALVEGPKQLGPWQISYNRPPVPGRFTDILQGL